MIDDDTLMAFADGALPDDEAEAILSAIEQDPVVAARFGRLQSMSTLLQEAYDAPMREPPPPSMIAAIHAAADAAKPEAEVIDFGARRQQKVQARHLPAWRNWGAIAASLLVGVVAGRSIMTDADSPRGNDHFAAASSQFAAAMNTAPSSTAVVSKEGTITPRLSFARADGKYCREFSIASADKASRGVACKSDTAWTLVALVPVSRQGADGGYQAASGAEDATIETILTQLGAVNPLDAAAEKAAIHMGWKN